MLLLVMCLLLSGCGQSGRQEEAIPVDREIGSGLEYSGRVELSYAEGFAIDQFEGGYTLLTMEDGSRFLVTPEDGEIPDGLDEDVAALRQPAGQIFLAASAVMDMFRSLEAIETIRLSGTEADGWYIEEARQAMERQEILYAGKYNAPDYELILSEGCSLSIQSTMVTHAPEVAERLQAMGIPVLVDRSSYESHPLGRVEWIRLYGAILGKEELAEELFAEQERALEEVLAAEESGKTVAFFYVTTNGAVSVRSSSDYIPRMIALAGGNYIFGDLASEGNQSAVTLQMEEFYAEAVDADYLVYNSSITGEISSVEELIGKNKLFGEFKAVQEGNVWCTTKNLYQESMSIGDMITDLHTMLTTQEEEAMTYLFRLR